MTAIRRLSILIGAAFFLTSCATSSNNILNPAGYTASQEAWLYRLILYMAAVVFVGVEGAIILFVIRYRRRKGQEGEPRQIYDNPTLEIAWTAIPVVLVIIIFAFTVNTMTAISNPPPSPTEMKVNVIGHQWWWEFDYPDLGIVTANQLHLPTGVNAQITLTSVDVIHSFWVPQLSGKLDVVPGQPNHTLLRSDNAGVYTGQCAEFCGTQHANMRFEVVVQSPSDFDTWVKSQQTAPTPPTDDLAKQGEQIVTAGICSGCHTVDGTKAKGTVGPNLTHLFSRSIIAGGIADLTDQNLTTWLEDSGSMKPGNDMQNVHMSPQQVQAIIAYLHTLK